jgi:hypothetical protein
MVRVWRSSDSERSERVRGVAVHLGSGRQITFSEAGLLVRFLAENSAAGGGGASIDTSIETAD